MALICGPVIGCGAVSDNSNNPDAAIDAPDTAAPSIVTSSPANNGKKASPLAPIVIRFDEALDPTSVNASTIKVNFATYVSFFDLAGLLKFDNTGVVPGSVAYDDMAHKIVFTPRAPLPTTARLQVVITGVKDLAGNTMTMQTLAFDTIMNPNVRDTNYNANGQVSVYLDYAASTNGQQGRYAQRLVGTDGIWFTADDTWTFRYESVFNTDGTTKEGVNYSVGTDGILGTADDVPTSTFAFAWDPGIRASGMTYFSSYGPDGLPGTADDVISQHIRVARMNDQFQAFFILFGPGVDGIWKTADDTGSNYIRYTYDAAGVRTRETSFSAGSDSVPDNANDVVQSYRDYRNDADGLQTHNIARTSGPDAIFLNADDGYSSYIKSTRNAMGLVTETMTYNGPGGDGIWVNGDDNVVTRVSFAYSAKGVLETQMSYNGPGADATWGTSDDVVGGYTAFVNDSNGARVSSKVFNSPGADGLWKTADDVYSRGVEHALGY